MVELASITLNKFSSGDDFGVFVKDVLWWDTLSGGGSIVYFRDGRSEKVTESVSTIQTSVNTLWDEFTTALGDPA